MIADNARFVVKAVVFHAYREPRFLALQRTTPGSSLTDLTTSHQPELWDLPGGNVQFGENQEIALRREINEECGLVVGSLRIVTLQTALNNSKDTFYILAGYYGQAYDGRVRLSLEHSAYRWVTADEFMLLPSSPFMRGLVQKVFSL